MVSYLFFIIYWKCLQNAKDSLKLLVLILLAAVETVIVAITQIGDPLSVPLFFVGIAIAQWPQQFNRFLSSVVNSVILIIIPIIVGIIWRQNYGIIHGAMTYLFIVLLIIGLRWGLLRDVKLPSLLSSISYDIYLVHYKVHLLVVFLLGKDSLLFFLLGTTIIAYLFSQFRKLVLSPKSVQTFK